MYFYAELILWVDVKHWTKQFSILKTYKTEFHDITTTFADQNGRPLQIKDKVSLTMLINV